MRVPAPPHTDEKIFRNSAVRTKSVNLASTVKRGGIRF